LTLALWRATFRRSDEDETVSLCQDLQSAEKVRKPVIIASINHDDNVLGSLLMTNGAHALVVDHDVHHRALRVIFSLPESERMSMRKIVMSRGVSA
jgi:hypothetical protein